MGSIEDIGTILVPDGQNPKQAQESFIELARENDETAFRSFRINGLAANTDVCLTGMRNELVLLSWSIVLLRTSEEGQVSFEWAYNRQSEHPQRKPLNPVQITFSNLQTSIEQAGTEILHNISTSSVDRSTPTSGITSLVLSTGILSQTTSEPENRVSKQI